jgi:hypothetical protein
MATNNDHVQPDPSRSTSVPRLPLPEAEEVHERDERTEDEQREERRPRRSRRSHQASRFELRSSQQWREDRDHLNILAILFYVWGGMSALMMSFFLIYVAMGIAMVSGGMGTGRNAPPPGLGWFFIALGSGITLFGWMYGVLIAVTGRFLSRRRSWLFCFVVACICCMQMPLGTTLGIFTIIVLIRPSVKDLFASVKEGFDPTIAPDEED